MWDMMYEGKDDRFVFEAFGLFPLETGLRRSFFLFHLYLCFSDISRRYRLVRMG